MLVKEHDVDVIGRPAFVFNSVRRPSQDQTILEPSGLKGAFEVQRGVNSMKTLIDAQRYEPEDIIVSEDKNTEHLVVCCRRHDFRTHEIIGGQQLKQTFPMPTNANLKIMKKS